MRGTGDRVSLKTKIDIRYLAALIDGEGCVSIQLNRAALQANKRPRVVFQLSISNTWFPLIQDLKRDFGGAFHAHQSTKKKRPEHKQGYNWTISERAACNLLRKVLPYLRVKRRQALLAIELLRLKNVYKQTKRGRPRGAPLTAREYRQRVRLFVLCHKLNRRGSDTA